MRNFKKRTLALVLASMVTVAGSFASNNYKNSLLGLKLESGGGGNVGVVLETRSAFSSNIAPVKKDANTYVIMLPEMNSEVATPDLSNVMSEIESVNIRTMPYTTAGSGYTRLTIKTYPNINLSASSKVYVPTSSKNAEIEDKSKDLDKSTAPKEETRPSPKIEQTNNPEEEVQSQIAQEETSSQEVVESSQEITKEPTEEFVETTDTSQNVNTNYYNTNDNSEKILLILGILLVITSSIYFYIKAKNKLASIVGETDFDFEDEDKDKNKEKGKTKGVKAKSKEINKAIKSIDSSISKTAVSSSQIKSAPSIRDLDGENIVDLDKLFQEQTQTSGTLELAESEEEYDALNDFLSGFSFSEEELVLEEPNFEIEEINPYYDEVINNDNLTFTDEDVDKINNLLNMEIADNTISELKKNVTVPIKKPSKKEILENLVTTYSISQDILFTRNDVKILFDLINIEIDPEFLDSIRNAKDLTLSEIKTSDKEIETLTEEEEDSLLKIEGLPDLDAALKANAGKKINCEVIPETIYFQEGYEVETISVDNLLSESGFNNTETSYNDTEIEEVDNKYETETISVENILKDSNYNDNSVSYQITEVQYVDTNYESKKLNVDGLVPDLNDVMENPEKYQNKKVVEVASEEDLLNRIENVTFKPFADEDKSFEEFNAVELEKSLAKENEEEIKIEDTKEISPQNNIKIENTIEEIKETPEKVSTDAFAKFDLEKLKQTQQNLQNKLQKIKTNSSESNFNNNSSDLLIQRIRNNRAKRAENQPEIHQKKQEQAKKIVPVQTPLTKCILDGVTYTVINTIKLNEKVGCHLAKTKDKYSIIGFAEENLKVLKEYDFIRNETIRARKSETLPDGTERFFVRVGINRFVLDVKDNNMNYLIDLC